MFSPLSIARCLVVDAGEEVEILQRDLARRNTEFVSEFALCSTFDTHYRSLQIGTSLAWDSQRVGAACIRPHS